MIKAVCAQHKDGGDFDQFAGATVTPRAVVETVRKAMQFYAANRKSFFAPSRTMPQRRTTD